MQQRLGYSTSEITMRILIQNGACLHIGLVLQDLVLRFLRKKDNVMQNVFQ